jgi:diguanylate cyclase (GGDEF)-like protein/PAS domain S-box-containing protein
MDKEDKSKKDLDDELESIREQIAHLQGLIQQGRTHKHLQPTPENEAGPCLKSDKRLLERLIHCSIDGILAFDRNLLFTVWNPGMERIFGINAEYALGRHAFEACPFLIELGEDSNFLAALKGEKAVSRNKRFPLTGTCRAGYYEGYYGPIYDSEGDLIGGLAIIRDITDRRLAEELQRISEERYRELFENACDVVYTHDLTGKITAINRAAERVTGYSRAEALKMRFNQLAAPEYQEIARRMLERQLAEGAPVTQEIDIIAKDSSRLTCEINSRLIFHEGKAIGIQGIARDITDRKRAEKALQKANQELESRVRELHQRTHEMTLLSELGDVLRACLTTEEVCEVIVRIAKEIFPEQAGALYVIGAQRAIVESVAEWGDTSKFEPTFAPEECWALRRGKTHWVQDSGIGLTCKHLYSPPPRGSLCVPMMAQSEALGILHLAQANNGPLPEAKQELAIAMAEHVAMALSNLKLNETLRSQSIRDQITGLFNRSFMEESLELELRRAIRSQNPLSIIMLSLDRFQQLHENLGAEAGDSVLKETSSLIQMNVRKGDIACRFGGQTFVLIMPQSSFETTIQRAENIRALARNLEIKYRNVSGRITVSIGLAGFPGHGQTVETLLRSAEAALHRAVANGDCVVAAN